ncbi:MAG: glycoside hydrolase family 18 protein [Ignavibacteriaceae bacterium]
MWRIFIASLFSILIISWSGCHPVKQNSGNEKYIVGYLFPRDSILNGNDIAVKQLTHINYAFANIKDGKIAQGFNNDLKNFKILNHAKKRNPNLNILISVGGWTWSGGFSDMCLSKESRSKFINSAIGFIKTNNLDGIDIDWEFPNLIGYGNVYRPEDKENFTALMKELRIALDELGNDGKHYWLTAATGTFDDYLANTEMNKVQKFADFINIMAYDFCEPETDSIAGHHTQLFTNPRDPQHTSSDAMVQKYIKLGVPPGKIVLGVAFYGHIWQVTSSDFNGLYEPGGQTKKHIRGSFKNLIQNYINKNGFVRYWDTTSSAPYLFNKDQKIFITYDDEESLQAKCRYINENNLRGAMFWEYTSDYHSRLLNALYDGLNNPDSKQVTSK